jgi:hypothetical protein
MDTAVSVELFVEILNRYVYYFDQQNEAVSSAMKLAFHDANKIGHYQVFEWTYRTDSFKLANQPRISHYRYAQTTFPAND